MLVIVVAPDVGTPALVSLMAAQPGRVRSAVVGDAGCVGRVEGSLAMQALVYAPGVDAMMTALGPAFFTRTANASGYANPAFNPDSDHLADYLASTGPRARLREQVRYLTGYKTETHRLAEVAPGIETPVLVMHGERDTLIALTHSTRLAEVLANSEFTVVPEAGHFAWEDNAPFYLEQTLAWTAAH